MYDGAELKLVHTRHIFGNIQRSSIGMEGLGGRGTEVKIFWASRFCQSPNGGLPSINNPHQTHIWDCSGIITGGGKLGVG